MKQRLPSSAAPALETLYNQFERRYDIADPIQRVRDFTDPRDQEIVGLLSSGLAFGRVRTIMRSIDAVLDVVGSSPSSFVRHFKPSDHRDTLGAINHRWIRGPDILAFVWVIRQILERSGSIQNFFLQGYDSNADDVGGAIDSFSERALGFDCGLIYASGQSRGVDYFFHGLLRVVLVNGSICICGGWCARTVLILVSGVRSVLRNWLYHSTRTSFG